MADKSIESKAKSMLPPVPGAEQDRLNVFAGSWNVTGQSYTGEQRRGQLRPGAVDWTSQEIYEWIPGSFFLVHRFNATVGSTIFIGLEVMGYDAANNAYFTQFFDNSGNHVEYKLSVEGNEWTWTGENQRAHASFSEDGNTLYVHWDWKKDGDWAPLCDLTGTKSE